VYVCSFSSSFSTFTAISTKRQSGDARNVYALHALLHSKESQHSKHALSKRFVLKDMDEKTFFMRVIPGVTLELTLAQMWNSLGNSSIALELEFRGPSVAQSSVSFTPADSIRRFDVQSDLKSEVLNLSGSVSTWNQTLLPDESQTKIMPLSVPRDSLPNGARVHQLSLCYGFELGEKTSVTPYAHWLCDLLYESEFQSQLWEIRNSHKAIVAVGDYRPKSSVLRAGNYTIQFFVSHEDPKVLELLKDMPISLSRSLSKKVSLSFHETFQNAITNSGKISKTKLEKGSSIPIFAKLPGDLHKSLPKKAPKGSSLIVTGEIVVVTNEGDSSCNLTIPFVAEVVYPKDKGAPAPKAKFELSVKELYRDSVVKWMSNLEGTNFADAYEKYGSMILHEFPNFLPLTSLHLKDLDISAPAKRSCEVLKNVLNFSNKLLELIDQNEIAAYFGVRRVEEEEGSLEAAEMNSKKEILIDILHRRSLACLDLYEKELESESKDADELKVHFNESVMDLKKWVDVEKETKYRKLYVECLILEGRLGKALGLLLKPFFDQDSPAPDSQQYDQMIDILGRLGWNHWKNYFEELRIRDFPKLLKNG
jgi:tripeptidyl-peptidase-2